MTKVVDAGIILYMHPTIERWRYSVTPSLIGWVHTQNDLWRWIQFWAHKRHLIACLKSELGGVNCEHLGDNWQCFVWTAPHCLWSWGQHTSRQLEFAWFNDQHGNANHKGKKTFLGSSFLNDENSNKTDLHNETEQNKRDVTPLLMQWLRHFCINSSRPSDAHMHQ